jgi:hypothetical protein
MNATERAAVPRGLWITLAGVAAATLVGEFFVDHHAKFGIDGSFAFYGWYTAVSAGVGVLAARGIAKLLGRRPDDDG